MRAYVARRLLQAVPLLLIVTFLSYSLILLLPGDPLGALVAGGESLDPEVEQRYREQFGLDKPMPVQYALWLGRAFQGDLGRSTQTGRPITHDLKSRIPATLQVGLAGLFVGICVGIPAGIAAAIWSNSFIDRAVTTLAVAGVALPGFWLAIMLILLLSVKLRWLPALGYVSIFDDPGQALKLLVMPAFVIGWELSAVVTRQLRSSMLEVLRQDYVRTARAKGLRERRVVWLHALKNALLPVATVIGLLLGRVLAGAVVIETVFAIPGMGRMLVSAVNARDFPAVQAIILVVAVTVVLMNLVTDLAYAALDPRIRYT
jgi:peptide/nickel transport system permease protein